MFQRICHYLKQPNDFADMLLTHLAPLIKSDSLYLKMKWRLRMGYPLNMKAPQTFNEKIQWLKLYDRKPIYTTMVDKYEAKKYVANIIGDEYLIPTLGIYNNADEIDFDALPNQFVLKCTHDSGGIVICRDKSLLNRGDARKVLNMYLHRRYYWRNREWPYKDVKPRIIAEEYMEDERYHELRDYKFFCFDGEVKALFVASDRQKNGEETKFDFFDADYNFLNIINGHPNSGVTPEKPQNFDVMKQLASKLSKDIPHVRVDFYEVNSKVYFGELTFSHWSGLVKFEPNEWDLKFGSWITLPKQQ